MIKAGEAEKLHIAIIGKKNVGKSLLINRIISQELFIVNDIPGKNTEPVSKAVELLPYGPIVILDAAGTDENEFDKKRINNSIKAISYADFAILVLDAREELDKSETELITVLQKIEVPFLVAVNKIEFGINPHLLIELEALEVTHFEISCKENAGIDNLKKKLIHLLPDKKETSLVEGLASQGDLVIMIIPDDFEFLQSDTIKLQVQTIRAAFDETTTTMIVKEKELSRTLSSLSNSPDLVITDSSAVKRIVNYLPQNVKLTTFSLITSNKKGNLFEFVKGLKSVKELQDGDKLLISEACDNHLQKFNIGKSGIQELLLLYTNKKLQIEISNGCDFPNSLSDFKLIIHCDGCSITRKIMQSRIRQAKLIDVPIINYSVLLALINGAIPLSILPFSKAVNIL